MATPETIEKMRALECSKFRLTEEQYLILHKYLPKIDKNKTEFFQPVGLSDTEADILRSAPHEYINVSGHDIQINVSLIDSLDEYSEQLYFAEHDNDPIEEIGIDIETYSSVDLTETGVYPYAEADDFEILLFAYSVNGSPVRVIDLASGEKIPQRILDALTDKSILKTAYNAAFERVCLSKYLGAWLDADDWDCTMVRAARLALPLSLAQCGEVLGLTQKKMTEGKALITYFSKPCKPTKVNGGRTRNLPEHAPDKWEVFKRYNKRDVEVEQAIRRKVVRLEITDTERRAWLLDQRINDRGVLVDMQLAQKASDMDDEYRANITEEAIKLTGLENPNSVSQLKEWLKNETGLDFPTLDKETVKDMLPRITSEKAKRVLRIRQELGKSSTAKYKAMLKCACRDNRVRGLFQFYGANRSGRFAGRLLQLQNLPQNHLPDLDRARNLVKNGDMEDVAMIYGNVPQTLSELIRTALIAKEGCTYHVCDFSAIEARVIAWVSGEEWVLNVFRRGGDIYCANASQMFHVIVEKYGQNAHLRPKGKIATLSCIAEGELVLTDKGLVPIEKVTTQHLLWDGEEWVHHEGVIFKGYKEVITYEGLTATRDHIVYIHEKGQYKQVQFGLAATCGSHIIQTGDGGANIRLGDNYIAREKVDARMAHPLYFDKMQELWQRTMAKFRKSPKRFVERLSILLSNQNPNSPQMVVEKNGSGKTKMPKSARPPIPELWRARCSIQILKRIRSCGIYCKDVWRTAKEFRNRPYRQQRALREGQYPSCNSGRELCEQKNNGVIAVLSRILGLRGGYGKTQTLAGLHEGANQRTSSSSSSTETQRMEDNSKKARVYDVRNAGKHHRFTVSGKLVHNCGYGGGVNALKAMGADKMGLTDAEMNDIIKGWRNANPNIVRFWKHCEQAALHCIRTHEYTYIDRNIKFEYKWGGLCITLPSKRQLFYPRIRQASNDRIAFDGMDQEKKIWRTIETYGGRLAENITQAIARDCLVETMLRLDEAGYKIVFHIHDETVIEATPDQTLEGIEKIFAQEIPWAKGLPLKGAGYTTPYYLKD